MAEQPDDATLTGYYRALYYPEVGSPSPLFENSDIATVRQHFEAIDAQLGLAGRRVLDYGCGGGAFMRVARERGCTVHGVEYDDIARRAASDAGYDVRKTIDAFGSDKFDFIYMNDVVEHLRDPVGELAQIRQYFVPEGALFLVTMNMAGLKPRLVGARWDVVTNPTHLWFYDAKSLQATLRAAGYPRVEVQDFRVDFPHHGSVRRHAQRALQRLRLDASLRVLTWPNREIRS